ncbi:acetolactate synthase-1/2/3 large subunit [Povalibacter uvarum]|uniref:Acetolactate synthase-1/2/3 large subunit n=1 Tax=Povalibacter uvarum TaxID=732238 RepID=A0A841HQU7_9GAMM|nr:thiamine pyrophosphate-dependent enzyme [Povalibacter uvarum]MBB6094285.1 acetolactate synthase-1/2/3 large subunit [Povalibacter uvarum]
MSTTVTAARRLVETLVANGVTHVFCVPGESYLAVLDALVDFQDRIQVITCRHEAGASNMAVAYAKLTRRPGVCFVTRGPGATHASIGIHTASQDSAPVIMFVGQVARADRGREGFQELDYPAVFGTMTKLAVEVSDPTRMVEIVTRAFATAAQGRHGPVVVSLPEDMLTEDAGPRVPSAVQAAPAGLAEAALHAIHARLEKSERPLMILGGTGWSDDALQRLADWAKQIDLPIALSWRRKDLLNNDHPCYVGDLSIRPSPGLNERIKQADLLIAIGSRMGDIPTTGYQLLSAQDAAEKLIHVHPSAEDINRVWQASLSAIANEAVAAISLSGLKVQRKWSQWRAAARGDYEKSIEPVTTVGAVNLSQVFTHMARVLPPDAILCNGAGNYAAWPNRFYRYRKPCTQLAPTSGAMGFGFPAGIAAKLVHPDRDVIAIAGDGCFLMTGQELATAVQHDVRLVTMVIDNGSYGTIRMYQEREYPKRVMATRLRNPDFTAYARSFGAWAATVERTEDFPAAFEAARKCDVPSLIHIRTSVEDILPGQRLPNAP